MFSDAWREYVGYDLDLIRPPFIVGKNVLIEEREYHRLLDGDADSCIELFNNRTCGEQLKVSGHW